MTHFNLQQLKEMREGISKCDCGTCNGCWSRTEALPFIQAVDYTIKLLEEREELKKRIEGMMEGESYCRIHEKRDDCLPMEKRNALSDVLSMLDGEKNV